MNPGRREFGRGLLALCGVASARVGVAAGLTPAIAATTATATARSGAPATVSGLVFPLAPEPGAWDALTMSTPRVLRFGPRDFRMWYYGRDAAFDPEISLPTGRVGLARSRDGVHWTRVRGPEERGSLFNPAAEADRFDSGHVGVGDVTFDGREYEMWYFGGDRQSSDLGGAKRRGFPLRIGRARSRDGLHWQRVPGPVRGAVLDVGAAGEPDASSVGWPQVIKVRPDLWRMYYHTAGGAVGFAICGAESTDQGLTWRRLGVLIGRGSAGRFDVNGASTRHVFRRGAGFGMLYEGWTHDRRPAIGLALSRDGVQWQRVDGPLPDAAVLAPPPAATGAWDSGAIGTPCLVEFGGGRSFMYYVGREDARGGPENDARYQIGLAVSDDPALLRWRRWQAG
jgi:hypothetical protein